MTTGLTRSSSPSAGSSFPQLDVSQTYAGLKEVANSVHKPEETRSYLGKGFKPLNYITYTNNPSLRADLAECTQRLKDLVTTAPDQEKQKKEMLMMLKLIFPSASSAANSHASTTEPQKPLPAAAPSVPDTPKENKDSRSNEIEEAIQKIIQNSHFNKAIMAAVPQAKPLVSIQIKQTQEKLTALLLLSDLLHVLRLYASSLSDSCTKLNKMFQDGILAFVIIDRLNNNLLFKFEPLSEEGIAFLCKWGKLLKIDDQNRFSVVDSSQYYSLYAKELEALASGPKINEVQIMARILLSSMAWDLSRISQDNIKRHFQTDEQQFLEALSTPSLRDCIVEYSEPWLLSLARLSPTNNELPFNFSEFQNYCHRLETEANALHAKREFLLAEYQKNYEAFQRLEARNKRFWQQHNKCLLPIQSIRNIQGFPSPKELEQRSFPAKDLPRPSVAKVEEKASAAEGKKKPKKKSRNSAQKKELKSSSSPAVPDNSSQSVNINATPDKPEPISAASSSKNSKKSLQKSSSQPQGRSSLSLQETFEEFHSTSSLSPRKFSEHASSNPFFSLDLSSPKVKSSSAEALHENVVSSNIASSSSSPTQQEGRTSFSDSERSFSSSPSSLSSLSEASESEDFEDFSSKIPHRKERKGATSEARPILKSSSFSHSNKEKQSHTAELLPKPLGTAGVKSAAPSVRSKSASSSPEPFVKPANSSPSALSLDRRGLSKSPSSPSFSGPLRSTSHSKHDSSDNLFPNAATPTLKPSGAETENKRNSLSQASSSSALPSSRGVLGSVKASSEDIFARGLKKIIYDRRVVMQRKNKKDPVHNFHSDFDRFLGTPYSRKTEWLDYKTNTMQPHYEIFCKVIPKGAKSAEESTYQVLEYCMNQQGKFYHRVARPEKSSNKFTNAVVQRARFIAENPTPAESLQLNSVSDEVVIFDKGKPFAYKIITSQEIVQFFDEEGNEYHVYQME